MARRFGTLLASLLSSAALCALTALYALILVAANAYTLSKGTGSLAAVITNAVALGQTGMEAVAFGLLVRALAKSRG